MADNTIDTLVIKIEGQDETGGSTLDKLINKLGNIQRGVSGTSRRVANFTKRMSALKSVTDNLKPSKFNVFGSDKTPSSVKQVTDRLNGLKDTVNDLNGTETKVISDDAVSRASKFSEKLSNIKNDVDSSSKKVKSFGDRVKNAFSDSIVGRFGKKVKETIGSLGRIALYRFMRSIIKEVTDAFSTGINNMYQYSLTFGGSFSQTMDRAASAMLSFKNSIGAAVAPLIEYLVPYLDKAVDKLMEINNTIAEVIAGLTGKSTFSKAVRVTTQYADAADKAAKSTTKVKDTVEKLSRSFAGIDEITVIGDLNNNNNPASTLADTINDAAQDYSTMFVETPVNMTKVDEIKERLLDILSIVGLIGAAIAAWNFTKALTGIKGLNSALTLAGIALTLTGATLLIKGVKNVITDGMDWENFWTLFFGAGALTAGTTVLGKVLSRVTGNTKWTGIGLRVGAGVGGAAMLFSSIYDTIMNTFDNGKASLESELSDYFSAVIGGALIGTAIMPGFGTIIGAGVGAIVQAITFFASNPKTVEKAQANISKAWERGTLAEDLKRSTAKAFQDSFDISPETAEKIGNIESFLATPFFSAIEGIKNAWNSIPDWFNNSVLQPVSGFFSDTGEKISGFFTGAWESVKGTWKSVTGWFDTNIIQPVSGFFSGLWDGISKMAHNAWVIISAVWITVSTWFDDNVIQPVSTFFSDAWTSISGWATDTWDSITNAWSVATTWFDDNVIQPIGNFFSELWDDVSGFFVNLWSDITDVWDTAATWFDDNVVQPVTGFFSDLWTDVSGFFEGLWDDVKGVWDTAATWFDDNVATPVSDAFETVTNAVSGFFSDMWTGIKNDAATAINWVIGGIEDAINGIIGGVNWFIGKLNRIGEWASSVTGMEVYYINEFQPVSLKRVSFKDGGFPEDGFFFANHNELVGQFSNGKTAVANNEQIVEGISEGVAAANREQNTLLREQNGLLRELLQKDSSIPVSTIVKAFNQKNRRDGKVTVPVAT